MLGVSLPEAAPVIKAVPFRSEAMASCGKGSRGAFNQGDPEKYYYRYTQLYCGISAFFFFLSLN
jgi:hypothetical protein